MSAQWWEPNLFDYATSELSQDAMLCWLLDWAKPENANAGSRLHELGRDLLGLIFEKCGKTMPATINKLDVRKQVAGIDILCTLNDQIAVIIEDKVGTQEHSDQLNRYMDNVQAELSFRPETILGVYVQTGDQSDYSAVLGSNYAVINRLELLAILESQKARDAAKHSDLLRQYAFYLRWLEDDVQSYLHLPTSNWEWNAWKGFFSHLQKDLAAGNWTYVPNPSGGFMGFWWHMCYDHECEIKLQLEMDKLCFKVFVEGDLDRAAVRNRWHGIVMEHCPKHGLKVAKPGRFGSGSFMTVAILEHDYRIAGADGLIDMAATVQLLRTAEHALSDCVRIVEETGC